MTGDDRLDYNLCAIRELLVAAFSAEELRPPPPTMRNWALCAGVAGVGEDTR